MATRRSTNPLNPGRRLFHATAGCGLVALGLLLPLGTVRWILLGCALFALTVEAIRFAVPRLNALIVYRVWLLKPLERRAVTGATFMAVSAAILFQLFSRDIAVFALLFLTVGDPIAALIGIRVRRWQLWNKSAAGTLAFLLAATAGIVIVGLLDSAVRVSWWAFVGAGVAAIVELWPVPLDDNLTVPLISALVMTGLAAL